MLDIGFFELLVVGFVLIVVMGPERLPEVAKKAAFFIRKARQGMYRLRNEMQSEIEGTPFGDLEKAKQEMADFKNDIKQFGRDLADSADTKIDVEKPSSEQDKTGDS
ncbi:Sec-independent protein translocase protein TatB [Arenicella xantha]|uniref:Tat protein translocase TatB subunit n=1 Tax=Arenicella xantha TaxID=644221 RepID=A0A395JGN6_9GAMM|nr:Sec-independent protein translocase protein TatB [Arenicella xantha]RBP48679.1 Tat protein translocase TatB subunit [Arenicella xantha]